MSFWDLTTDRGARIAWSMLAEPTDAVAQLARAALGPAEALELARRATPQELLARLGERLPAEPSEPAGSDLDRARRALDRWRRREQALDLDRTRSQTRRHSLRILTPEDTAWPQRLDDLGTGTPPCLWLRGHGDLEPLVEAPSIALVGSRAATAYGLDTAADLGHGLARHGRTVISGGAYGIDAAAHRGALAADGTATIAVLACGLDALYPRGNAELLTRIAQSSLLVSESPPGTAPTRWRFLARNRLIAALTETTVVIEAAWRSGALSTARWADDLSRPVGAVPGPVTSAASAGCHRLIRERGAVLVTSAEEILDLVPGGPAAPERQTQDELDLLSPSDRRVLDAVPPRSSRRVAALAADTGIPTDEVTASLARLELLGMVTTSSDAARRRRS